MATFITLCKFTEQGIRDIKESPHRAEAFEALASKLGLTVKGLYWTIGAYDVIVVLEGGEEAALAALLKTGSLGNVQTETLRAYTASEITKILGMMP